MINRTRIKDSIYDILNEDPKKIKEYIDTEAEKTPEQKEKEKEERDKQSNIEDINLQENINNQDENPYNQILVYTEKDNLIHNYFHYFDLYWDARDVLSSVTLKLPKTDVENTKYWITYTGNVIIYLGNEINTEMHKNKGETDTNKYFDLNGMQSIFKGDIGRIKEYYEELEIHVDSIGKRFKQKIPDEFRESFINNQNVRDAFQAICEFLGVRYICPPKTTTTQDDKTEEQTASGDGTENDVNKTVEQESSMASEVGEATNNESDDQNNESNNEQSQNTDTQNQLTDSTQENLVQNGYGDISFDAGGAIVHGSNTIITSPDMEDTLLSMENHPLDSYLEDTTFVATDVKRFLDGEVFEELHNRVMSYDAITIEPKSAPTSDMSTVGGTTNGTTNNSESGDSSLNGWHDGQLYENGKIVLWNSYIQTLSPQQAADKYNSGQDTYTEDTLQRLLWHANKNAILGGH